MTSARYPALNGARSLSAAVERGAFLAVAGNLGVGKTTLVELVTRATDFEPHYELAEENPYLARFYADMRAWGFHSQLFFLVKRSEQHRRLASSAATAVQDRTIYEDAEIWARNLYERGQIANEDYRLYSDLYEELCRGLPPPDLVLYLAASTETLKKRIAIRGRSFEAGIETSYVERLNQRYEEWAAAFDRCPLIRLETDEVDLAHSAEDRADVLRLIRASLSAHRPDVQWPVTLAPDTEPTL
ncbi:MAG TPA: deoxynucleoside kinase [Ktedonobacterales bacterium]|jgi:deoxyadenosine/deoxycytidine kinase